jgi:hypothetical protein
MQCGGLEEDQASGPVSRLMRRDRSKAILGRMWPTPLLISPASDLDLSDSKLTRSSANARFVAAMDLESATGHYRRGAEHPPAVEETMQRSWE